MDIFYTGRRYTTPYNDDTQAVLSVLLTRPPGGESSFILISCLEHLVTVAWFREAPGKAGHNPRNAAEQKGNIVRR